MMFLAPSNTPLFSVNWPGRGDVFVKDESVCSTGTFKDRLAAGLVEQLRNDANRHQLLVTCITLGNTAISIAAALATEFTRGERPAFLGIFPRGFSARRIGPDTKGRGAKGQDILEALESFDGNWMEADLDKGYLRETDIREMADSSGITFMDHRDVTNGIGFPCYEAILAEALASHPDGFDFAVVPVGAGVLFDEFVSFVERNNLATTVIGATTLDRESIADKIYGRYSPYFDELQRSGLARSLTSARHCVYSVQDDAIRSALELIPKHISAEPSAAAAFSLLLNHKSIPADSSVLIVNTGNGITEATDGPELLAREAP